MGLPILNLKSVGMNWVIDPKKKEVLPPDFMSRLTRLFTLYRSGRWFVCIPDVGWANVLENCKYVSFSIPNPQK